MGQAILPAAAFQAARRLKAGGSQDWLPHITAAYWLIPFSWCTPKKARRDQEVSRPILAGASSALLQLFYRFSAISKTLPDYSRIVSEHKLPACESKEEKYAYY